MAGTIVIFCIHWNCSAVVDALAVMPITIDRRGNCFFVQVYTTTE